MKPLILPEFQADKRARSIAYIGNIVDLWERLQSVTYMWTWALIKRHSITLGWRLLSLGLSYEESNEMMANNPQEFKTIRKP